MSHTPPLPEDAAALISPVTDEMESMQACQPKSSMSIPLPRPFKGPLAVDEQHKDEETGRLLLSKVRRGMHCGASLLLRKSDVAI